MKHLKWGKLKLCKLIQTFLYLKKIFIYVRIKEGQCRKGFFLTFTVNGWVDVFTSKDYAEIILESLKYCQEHKGLLVYAFVIMPSHVHLIAQHSEGRSNEVIRDIKSYTAKQILDSIKTNNQESRKEWLLYLFSHFAKGSKQNKGYMFWNKTKCPIELFSNRAIKQKTGYIHQNPVRSGFVKEPRCYTYSSANQFPSFKCNYI